MADMVSGARASIVGARAGRGVARGMRLALMGSTALVGLAVARPAAAQQDTSLTNGGRISVTSGDAAVTQGAGVDVVVNSTSSIDVDGVNIANPSTGQSTVGLRISGPNLFPESEVVVTFKNSSKIGSSNGDAVQMQFDPSQYLFFNVSDSVEVAGLNGIHLIGGSLTFRQAADAGYIIATALTDGAGTGVLLENGDGFIGQGSLGTVVTSGFSTGIGITAGAIEALTINGGMITSSGSDSYGIRIATTGEATLTSLAAISADNGIEVVSTDNVNVTTGNINITPGTVYYYGTIDGLSNGVGTGITARGGAGVSVNQLGEIGGSMPVSFGINAVTSSNGGTHVFSSAPITVAGLGSARGIIATSLGGPVEVITRAAIKSEGGGVYVDARGLDNVIGRANITINGAITLARSDGTTSGTGLSAFNVAADSITYINANITGGGTAAATRGTTTVARGVTVSGKENGIVQTAGGTVINAGTIASDDQAVTFAGILNNLATGTITSTGDTGAAVYAEGGATINNDGQIDGTIGSGIASGEGGTTINNNSDASIVGEYGVAKINNSLTDSSLLTINNTRGDIFGLVSGINVIGGARLLLNNTGTIQTVGGISGPGLSGIYLDTSISTENSITNSGTIAGGSDATNGYGVVIDAGLLTLTNRSGGQISGRAGAIKLNTAGATTVTLDQNSSTGAIFSGSSGGRVMAVNGALTGVYAGGTGTGVVNWTLGQTGRMVGATFGSAADIFTYKGGTISGMIDAGEGSDSFVSALGTGTSATLFMPNLVSFESYTHQTGALTLTGEADIGPGWTMSPGSTITLAGSLFPDYAGITLNGNGEVGTIRIAAGGEIVATSGVIIDSDTGNTFINNGRISAVYNGLTSSGSVVATNTGSIDARQNEALAFESGNQSLINSGSLRGGASVNAGVGVRTYSTLVVTNQTGGYITGGGSAGIVSGISTGGVPYGGLLTIDNEIGARITGPTAIITQGLSGLALTNAGQVVGFVSAINATGTGGTTITNTGLLGASRADGSTAAVLLASGTITNGGTIDGAIGGISASDAADVIRLVNTGTITARGIDASNSAEGVYAAGGATVFNAGTITTPYRAGIFVDRAGVVVNASAGVLTGGLGGVAVNLNGGGIFTNFGQATSADGTAFLSGSNTASVVALQAGSTTAAVTMGGGDDILSIHTGAGTASTGMTYDSATGQTEEGQATGPTRYVAQQAGTLAAPVLTGPVDLGAGINTLNLRGSGDGTAANGAAGTFNMGSVAGATNLYKLDAGDWTLTGTPVAGLAAIHAGNGTSGDGGTLTLSGTTGLTSDIYVNGATIIEGNSGAFGTGAIHSVDPTIVLANGTNANDYLLEVAAPASTDPTTFRTAAGNIVTLTGSITTGTGDGNGNNINGQAIDASQPVTFATTPGLPDAPPVTFVLANAANNWTGTTTIDAGVTLRGTTATISGGDINLNGSVVYAQDDDGTVAKAIIGYGTLVKDGTGTVRLTASTNGVDSDHLGDTTVLAGRLVAVDQKVSGGIVAVSAGAMLEINYNQTVNGDGSPSVLNQRYTAFTGAGTVRKTGAGTLAIVGTFSQDRGGLLDVVEGTVKAGFDSIFSSNLGDLNIAAGARFDGDEAAVSFDRLTGAGVLSGGYFGGTSGSSNIVIGALGGSSTFDGTITDNDDGRGNMTGQVKLFKEGAGTLTLTGSHAYTADTTIHAGTLALTGTGSIANSAILVGGGLGNDFGGTFDISGVSGDGTTIDRLYNNGAVNNSAIVLGDNTLTLADGHRGNNFDGVISGSGGVTIGRNASLYLGGTNTFTGTMRVADLAELTFTANDVLSDNSTLTIDSGGTLDLGGFSDRVGTLNLSGTLRGEGTLSADNYNVFAGSRIEQKLEAGAVNIYGGTVFTTATRSSVVNIFAGTLTLGDPDAIGDPDNAAGDFANLLAPTATVNIASGATLTLGGAETIGSLSDLNGGGGTIDLAGAVLTVDSAADTTFSGVIGNTGPRTRRYNYVGSYSVGDGPDAASNPIVYSGQSAAALLFGGNASDYAISTNGTDPIDINFRAYADGRSVDGVTGADIPSTGFLGNPAWEGYSLSINNNGGTVTGYSSAYYAYSAFVRDNTVPGEYVNYVFNRVATADANGFTKTGAGTLTLTGANTYTGTTMVASGATLALGNGGTSGSVAGLIVADGTLDLNRLDSVLLSNVIAGTGVVNKLGAGTTTLSGSNGAGVQFTGTLNVNAGTLSVGGTFGDTAANRALVTVNNGGTLHGTGTIAGSVGVKAGGTVSAGNSPGTLTVLGNYTLDAGSTSLFELGTPDVVGGPNNDLINVGGNLTLGGTLRLVNAFDASWALTSGDYRLFNYGGTLAGSFGAINAGGTNPADANLDVGTAGQVNLAIRAAGQQVQYWDGGDAGLVDGPQGGAGTWNTVDTSWTDESTTANRAWAAGVGIFGTAGDIVRVEGTQGFQGLQFTVDGYQLTGPGSLAMTADTFTTADQSFVTVDADVTATIGTVLTGNGIGLIKFGTGNLVLTGANTYTGTTTIAAGTLTGTTTSIVGADIVNNGVLAYTQDTSGTVAQAITGTGNVRVSGGAAATLTFAGSNAFTGAAATLAAFTSFGPGLTFTGSNTSVTDTVNLAGGNARLAVASTGSLASSGGNTVYANLAEADVVNAGSIRATSANGAAMVLNAGGTVTNGGTIDAAGGVALFGSGTTGTTSIANQAGGTIASGFRAIDLANVATVTNAGTISGGTSTGVLLHAGGSVDNAASGAVAGGSNGITFVATGRVANAGRIDGAFAGISQNATGATLTVTTATGGTINGTQNNAIYTGNGAGIVTNAGTLTGGNAAVYADGALTLGNSGLIRNTVGGNAQAISGVYASAGNVQITNTGMIDSLVVGGHAIKLDGGNGSIVNLAGGTLAGFGGGAAVLLSGANYTLDLRSGGAVTGAVDARATTGTNDVTLAGTLTGDYIGGSGIDNVTLVDSAEIAGTLDGGAGGDALILTGAATGAFNTGNLVNFESVTKTGAGRFTLSGVDASNAGYAIDQGVLSVSGGAAINDAALVTIAASGSLDLASNETIGSLAGAGTVTLGANTLTLVGSQVSTYLGVMSGSGGLTYDGTGTFGLVGDQALTGHLTANAGTLLLSGITAGSGRIQGGTMAGTGGVAGNLALASGTLSPGSATQPVASLQAGSLTVTGGSYAVDFGGTPNGFVADVVRVSGTATLAGAVVTPRALDATNGYRLSQTYTVLQAGSLTGQFANAEGFTTVGNNADLGYRLRYDLVPNTVLLEVRKQIDFTAGLGGGTRNQQALGAALNGGAFTASDGFATMLNALAALSPADRAAAFDSIGGEALADITSSVALASNRFTDIVRARLSRGGGIANATGGAELGGLYDPLARSTALRAAAQTVGASALADGNGDVREGGIAGWVQGYGSDGRIVGVRGQRTLDNDTAGLAMGMESRFGALTLGLVGTITDVDANVYSLQSKNSGTLYQGGGYVGYDDGANFAQVSGSYYGGTIDTARTVAIGGTPVGRARAEANTSGYTAGAAMGHRFGGEAGYRFAPQISVQTVHVTRDAFTETGAGDLSLVAGRDKRNMYTATAEGRLSHRTLAADGGLVEPYVTGGVQVNFGERDTLAALSIAGAPIGTGAYTVEGTRLARVAGIFGGGIDAHPTDRITLGAGVETTLSNRQKEGRVSMRLHIGF